MHGGGHRRWGSVLRGLRWTSLFACSLAALAACTGSGDPDAPPRSSAAIDAPAIAIDHPTSPAVERARPEDDPPPEPAAEPDPPAPESPTADDEAGAAEPAPDPAPDEHSMDPAPLRAPVARPERLSASERVALVEAALAEPAAEATQPVEALRATGGAGDGRGAIGLAGSGRAGFGAGRSAPSGIPEATHAERAIAVDAVPGALGLSPSIQLFTFRADPERGLAAHPVQCRPERILETVTAVINRAAGPCEAQRNLLAQAGIELAYVTCGLSDPVPGCRRTYIGTLWVERTPGTHHDYQLQGFGRVARQCGARTERLSGPVDRRVARHGAALGKLFDICGDRLSAGATSNSASSSDAVRSR